MKIFTLCIFDKNKNFNFEKLSNNKEFILEIIYSNKCEKKDIISLDLKDESEFRARCVDLAKGDYLVWLSGDSELEDTTFDEFYETINKSKADVIYPNEIKLIDTYESIKKYNDWYQKENELLQALSLDEYLPKWGVATKKSILKFEKKYKEEIFYAFIYKNLKKISLKLSDESFVINKEENMDIDLTYKSLLLRDVVKQYDLKELFRRLNWNKEDIAYATSFSLIGEKLFEFNDFFNASSFFRKALISFHNQDTLKKLINTYYQMGLFDEAKKVIDTQNSTKDIKDEFNYKIEQTKKLIDELEKVVKAKKLEDIIKAKDDIFDFYSGAPIQNIYGIVMYYLNDPKSAYSYFYKAVSMNPLEKDMVENLAEVAKLIDKKEEVIALIDRLTK